eukprot:TRINITY_DN91439_c0_g1_i1.p1 TRINITY_DN91439_c0_g1~~TRINITY_DN91439_c0_g1_i1.p1  ORF type:complete len:891 (+),score=174.95 TRINITY_DN91439_c0_g1_i1:62-2674(+)
MATEREETASALARAAVAAAIAPSACNQGGSHLEQTLDFEETSPMPSITTDGTTPEPQLMPHFGRGGSFQQWVAEQCGSCPAPAPLELRRATTTPPLLQKLQFDSPLQVPHSARQCPTGLSTPPMDRSGSLQKHGRKHMLNEAHHELARNIDVLSKRIECLATAGGSQERFSEALQQMAEERRQALHMEALVTEAINALTMQLKQEQPRGVYSAAEPYADAPPLGRVAVLPQVELMHELIEAVKALKSPLAAGQQTEASGAVMRQPSYVPAESLDGAETSDLLFSYPEVSVAVKVYKLSNVDTSQMTFEVDFVCDLDWMDENVRDIRSELLPLLDWSKYFNPMVEIDNAKDAGCSWMPGGDETPRRHEFDDNGAWLCKTMRFRGTLSLSSVNLRCFPFDIQVLPIKLKAARIRSHAVTTPRGHKSSSVSSKIRLVDEGPMSRTAHYRCMDKHLRGRGHHALAAADETLLEFNIQSITGCHAEPFRPDTYEVHILVERPRFGSYVYDIVIINLLVCVSATAFWDTAAPELSSRMSISLTVILTIAAYTSSRPAPIEKAPYVTFHDWSEQVSMLLVTGISIQNVFAVVLCGGQHEEAPPYMREIFESNEELCSVGWCYSRNIDCRALLVLIVSWSVLFLYSLLWLRRSRRASKVKWSRILRLSCACDSDDVDTESEGGATTSTRRSCCLSRCLRRMLCCCCRRWTLRHCSDVSLSEVKRLKSAAENVGSWDVHSEASTPPPELPAPGSPQLPPLRRPASRQSGSSTSGSGSSVQQLYTARGGPVGLGGIVTRDGRQGLTPRRSELRRPSQETIREVPLQSPQSSSSEESKTGRSSTGQSSVPTLPPVPLLRAESVESSASNMVPRSFYEMLD